MTLIHVHSVDSGSEYMLFWGSVIVVIPVFCTGVATLTLHAIDAKWTCKTRVVKGVTPAHAEETVSCSKTRGDLGYCFSRESTALFLIMVGVLHSAGVDSVLLDHQRRGTTGSHRHNGGRKTAFDLSLLNVVASHSLLKRLIAPLLIIYTNLSSLIPVITQIAPCTAP